jgi:hypothetical protein
MRHTVTVFVCCLAVISIITVHDPVRANEPDCSRAGTVYMRTTLYFGMTHTAGTVTEDEWETFLREQVTPHFPNGLTVWTASGQWRESNRTIAREQAKVLLLLHDKSPKGRAAVQAIIDRYKATFRQESVLSETAAVCAAF